MNSALAHGLCAALLVSFNPCLSFFFGRGGGGINVKRRSHNRWVGRIGSIQGNKFPIQRLIPFDQRRLILRWSMPPVWKRCQPLCRGLPKLGMFKETSHQKYWRWVSAFKLAVWRHCEQFEGTDMKPIDTPYGQSLQKE